MITGLCEEEIETPAGKFKTIKVERVAEWKRCKSGKRGVSRWVYWYASHAKSAVRYERTKTTVEGRVLLNELHKLVAFPVK